MDKNLRVTVYEKLFEDEWEAILSLGIWSEREKTVIDNFHVGQLLGGLWSSAEYMTQCIDGIDPQNILRLSQKAFNLQCSINAKLRKTGSPYRVRKKSNGDYGFFKTTPKTS